MCVYEENYFYLPNSAVIDATPVQKTMEKQYQ